MMNYQEFKEMITAAINDQVNLIYPSMEIQPQTVTKNNGVVLNGLAFKGESNLAPTVYIDSLYESYENGRDITDLISEVIDCIDNTVLEQDFDITEMSWETAKSKVFLQVIGEKENQDKKQNIPFRKAQDMLLTYRILFDISASGMASSQITNVIQEVFHVTEEDLYQAAIHNMPKLFPVVFQSMNSIMENMILGITEHVDTLENTLINLEVEQKLYVLTNEQKTFGASALFYPEVMEKIAHAFDCNMFILPSSIHEVILVPCMPNMVINPEELKQMVIDINHEVVSPEEILTNQVYFYDRKTKALKIADE